VYRSEKREDGMEELGCCVHERGSDMLGTGKKGNGEGEVSGPDREVWRLVRKWEEELLLNSSWSGMEN
jgi:hypothetical protein